MRRRRRGPEGNPPRRPPDAGERAERTRRREAGDRRGPVERRDGHQTLEGSKGPSAAPEPAADRALLEQEVERLAKAARDELEALKRADEGRPGALRRAPPEGAVEAERRARFARRVKRGEVDPAATLDLHGLTEPVAVDRLRRFLSGSSGEAVLVIHGKGLGILRAAVVAELDRHPRVAEHLDAPRAMGGAGARLVRLRQR